MWEASRKAVLLSIKLKYGSNRAVAPLNVKRIICGVVPNAVYRMLYIEILIL